MAPRPPRPPGVDLSATYWDTADLRLLRSRLTLRRRVGGDDAGWHLKLPAGADSRDEVRRPLGRARKPPAPLVALSRAAHRDAPLRPVVELDTVRQEWTLTDAQGEAVATVTDDRVTARTLGAGSDGGTTVDTEPLEWAEIEVELAGHGTPEVLDRIEDALLRAGVHRSASASKLGRVLAERVPPAPPRPVASPDATAGQVVLAYVAEQAETIRATDPQVRRDAPEAVHDMRVACRRMRSSFQSFRALLDRSRTDDLVVELRWLAGELGGARDLEVQEARIVADVAALPPELALGPVAAQTTRFFATRRASAAATATAALDSDRYLALLDAVDALLADPPLTDDAARPAVEILPELIGKAVRRTRKHLRAAHAHPPGHERDLELHEMRKAGKRLRYAAEVSAPALGKAGEAAGQSGQGAAGAAGRAPGLVRRPRAAARAGRRRGDRGGERVRVRLAAARRAGPSRGRGGRRRRGLDGGSEARAGPHELGSACWIMEVMSGPHSAPEKSCRSAHCAPTV